ncbi:hypothetical protein GGS24DRAFT_444243 [Hypoxylon argillaceum]|nr:hypothetical protein GGS24DRAFT_444243 [Hypoxylon argillaceum]
MEPSASHYSEHQLSQAAAILGIPVRQLAASLSSQPRSHPRLIDPPLEQEASDNANSILNFDDGFDCSQSNAQTSTTLSLETNLPDISLPDSTTVDASSVNDSYVDPAHLVLPVSQTSIGGDQSRGVQQAIDNSHPSHDDISSSLIPTPKASKPRSFSTVPPHIRKENQLHEKAPSKSPDSSAHPQTAVKSNPSVSKIAPHPTNTQSHDIQELQLAVLLGPCSKVWEIPKKRTRKSNQTASNAPPKRQRNPVNSARDVPVRRGAFTDPRDREMTALTRILKSCIRCRMQRTRCEPDPEDLEGPCLTCKRLSRPTLAGLGCLRFKITDAVLYREQTAPHQFFTRRWQNLDLIDITDWSANDTKTIELRPVLMEQSYSMKYRVRQFRPVDGDMLEEKWSSNGVMQAHRIPPYAIESMEEAADDYKIALQSSVYTWVRAFVGKSDPLLLTTFEMACRHAAEAATPNERCLIADTLRLWVVCRETSSSTRIVNEAEFGIPKVDDPNSPWFAYVPIPPMLIAQLQCVMYTKFLIPLSKAVLNRLNEMVICNNRKYWLTIYLVIFVLLHNCTLTTRRNEQFARQMSLTTRFANPYAIKAHHSGAITLLAHFHYLNKGAHPFTLSQTLKGRGTVIDGTTFTQQQVDFVKATASRVQTLSTAMSKCRAENEVGNDLYWISQLYMKDWKPLPLVV